MRGARTCRKDARDPDVGRLQIACGLAVLDALDPFIQMESLFGLLEPGDGLFKTRGISAFAVRVRPLRFLPGLPHGAEGKEKGRDQETRSESIHRAII